MSKAREKGDHFAKEGYILLDFKDLTPILEVRDRLKKAFQEFFNVKDTPLEDYHKVVGNDDDKHTEVQWHITEKLRREKWHLPIFQRELVPFLELIGPDLDVEAEPYLRIVRPGTPQDNIGYHRDTIYGASPYELSVIIPFVDLDEDAALWIEPGSHLKPESQIPFHPIENPDPQISKGSIKHRLGFPYTPKVLDKSYPIDRMIPVPLHVGQALVFGLSLLHGSVLNSSKGTRWSCDVRIKNAFAPVDEARQKRFLPLALGPVTQVVREFLKTSQKQKDLCLLCRSDALVSCYEDTAIPSVTSDCKPWPYPVRTFYCRLCGHLQKLRSEDPGKTRLIYQNYEIYHLSGGVEQVIFQNNAHAPKKRSDQILERLPSVCKLPERGELLDIGCGNGVFLSAFAKRYPNWKLFGFEQTDLYREHLLSLPNIQDFFSGTLEAVNRKFDVISLIHVLEHVAEPIQFLHQIRSLLKGNGLLLIQLPNILKNPLDVVVIDHYSHFSPTLLTNLTSSCDYDTLFTATDWVPKEITLGVSAGPQKGRSSLVPVVGIDSLSSYFKKCADWLHLFVREARAYASSGTRLGIFGTAVSGTWLGAVLGEKARFFVDEDTSRVGKYHIGKPVLHPKEVKKEDSILIVFSYEMAKGIRDRLIRKYPGHYLLPPPFPAEEE